jgi:tRNA G18 (ribose-2'-O)-methylase SpoU
MSQAIIILDNIRSVYNVGSIFRTADTLGIKKIYCIGTTPTPLDRFGRKRKDFAKVSLGAEETLEWQHIGKATEDSLDEAIILIKSLKKEGFKIISLEQSLKSIDYKDVECTAKTVIILGNEVNGVSKELLEISDEIAEIDMVGNKESLNVSVAGAVFLFRLLDK